VRPCIGQVVPSVGHGEQIVVQIVPRQAYHAPEPRCKFMPILLELSFLIRIESPYSRPVLQDRAWVYPWRKWRSVVYLTVIGWRSEDRVHIPFLIERQRLRVVLTGRLGIGQDQFHFAVWNKVSRQFLPENPSNRAKVEIAIMDPHLGAIATLVQIIVEDKS